MPRASVGARRAAARALRDPRCEAFVSAVVKSGDAAEAAARAGVTLDVALVWAADPDVAAEIDRRTKLTADLGRLARRAIRRVLCDDKAGYMAQLQAAAIVIRNEEQQEMASAWHAIADAAGAGKLAPAVLITQIDALRGRNEPSELPTAEPAKALPAALDAGPVDSS